MSPLQCWSLLLFLIISRCRSLYIAGVPPYVLCLSSRSCTRTLSTLKKWSKILIKVTHQSFFFVVVASLVFLSGFKHIFPPWLYFSCLTRKHHEGCVSGSSAVGQRGHPGHEGNTRRILSSTHPPTNVNTPCFHRPSQLCRDRLKASARSSTPNPVTPHWRSTRTCLLTAAKQTLACCRWGGANGANCPSEELYRKKQLHVDTSPPWRSL